MTNNTPKLAEAKKLIEEWEEIFDDDFKSLQHKDGDYSTCASCYCEIGDHYLSYVKRNCKGGCKPKGCDCGEEKEWQEQKDFIKNLLTKQSLISYEKGREEQRKASATEFADYLEILSERKILTKKQSAQLKEFLHPSPNAK